MENIYSVFGLALILLGVGGNAVAQGPGSSEATGGTAGASAMDLVAGDVTASASESLYIGPGIYTIDGVWEVYSKNVWISPDATFAGTGTLKFMNPSVAGGAPSATLIDGNNSTNFINVNIELDNASGMSLTDIEGPGAPWTDATGLANLSTGADFKFNVANGNVELGNFDMITASSATLSGYQPSRFVVTNGSGHLVHQNYTGNFVYPVGVSAGDYTPAAINSTAANTFHVSVQDYASSASPETGDNGIDRTWNIYTDNGAVAATVDLEHNSATDQASFNDGSEFVTRWGASTPNTTGDNMLSQTSWQSNTLVAGDPGVLSSSGSVPGAIETSHSYSSFGIAAGDPIAFYTKSSNQLTPLPITLVSFEGTDKNCQAVLQWSTSMEMSFDHFDVQQSNDGIVFKTIATVRGNQAAGGSAYSGAYDQPAGSIFYRLGMVDKDGSVTYSNTIVVRTSCDVGDKNQLSVYPNPLIGRGQLYVRYTASTDGSAVITCHDANGRLVYSYPVTLQQGINTITLPAYEMAKGVFLFRLVEHAGSSSAPVKVLKN